MTLRSPRATTLLREKWSRAGLTVGFVPTMGALHAGHLSLIERARRENDKVVVSIFVNPLQFGPKEDLARYPRPFRRDLALCREAGADALYHPSAEALYPAGFSTSVEVSTLSETLCGALRPGHFRGVATVVAKLLCRLRPHALYLGEKDFQQLAVLRRMVLDLELPVRVVGCPTVREPDGLALSSRNAYLSPEERARAPRLHRALLAGRGAARLRGADRARVRAAMRRELSKDPDIRAEYLEVVDADTLRPPRRLSGRLRLLGAVRVGKTRLIDNIPLICKDGPP